MVVCDDGAPPAFCAPAHTPKTFMPAAADDELPMLHQKRNDDRYQEPYPSWRANKYRPTHRNTTRLSKLPSDLINGLFPFSKSKLYNCGFGRANFSHALCRCHIIFVSSSRHSCCIPTFHIHLKSFNHDTPSLHPCNQQALHEISSFKMPIDESKFNVSKIILSTITDTLRETVVIISTRSWWWQGG